MTRSLQDLSRTELTWKLDLVIAVLLRVLNEAKKPGSLIQDSSPEAIESTVLSNKDMAIELAQLKSLF